MVIKTETYPGFGYQVQQTYMALQEGYYSPNDCYGLISNDHYGHGSGTHMPTTPYITNTPVLKPSGGYGQHHNSWLDTNKPYHGSNSHITIYDNREASKYNGGHSEHHGKGNGGYETYHGAQAPMGGSRMESIKYEYSSSARPTMDHNSHGLQSGYNGVWEIKKIDN